MDPSGDIAIAAEDLFFPNGAVITPDGKTFIISETFGHCLSAFDMASDGILTHRREFARFAATAPDGICLDEAGGVWVCSPGVHEVIRVIDGGRITDTIPLPPDRDSFACVLGGSDRRDLYIGTACDYNPSVTRANARDASRSRASLSQVRDCRSYGGRIMASPLRRHGPAVSFLLSLSFSSVPSG